MHRSQSPPIAQHPQIHGRRTLGLRAVAVKTANAISGGHHIRIPWDPPPVNAQPRYGYGRPSHARLAELFSRGDNMYRDVLRGFQKYADDLAAIPLDETGPHEPHWRSGYLFGIDGASLYAFIRTRMPRRYIEVGSGNSTLFVDRARRDGDIDMEIISVDPSPRREINSICDRIIRKPLEEADLEMFSELEEGDVLFMDGTHRVFMNSDVTAFFLDVLPELAPGVLVGIHDIHLPDDYRPEHNDRYYSEQYLLAAYLLGEPGWMRTVLPSWYVCHHPELKHLAHALIPPAFSSEDPDGVIFWLVTGPRERRVAS
jgi:predicted O-methyltransferase YrrM